jgi:hypothetical protein
LCFELRNVNGPRAGPRDCLASSTSTDISRNLLQLADRLRRCRHLQHHCPTAVAVIKISRRPAREAGI